MRFPLDIRKRTELEALRFREEFAPADSLLLLVVVVLAAAGKQHDEVDLLHILGERTDISLNLNKLVVIFVFVELVGN